MPYKIVYRPTSSRPWKIVDENGKVRGSSTSRTKAESSINARLAGEHGWKPKRK